MHRILTTSVVAAARPHPDATAVTGSVCGVHVEEVATLPGQRIPSLDEPAGGRPVPVAMRA